MRRPTITAKLNYGLFWDEWFWCWSCAMLASTLFTSFYRLMDQSALRLAVCGGSTECTDMGCLGMVYRCGSKCTGIPEPTQEAELSLSVSLSLTHTHMHARAHTQARTRMHTLPPPPPPPPSHRTYLFPSFYLHVTSSSYLPSVSVYRFCQYALGSATRNPLKTWRVSQILDCGHWYKKRERANHCSIVYLGIHVQNTGIDVKCW